MEVNERKYQARVDLRKQPTGPCFYCSGNHWNDECKKYQTAEERKQKLKWRCFSCLKNGHRAFECKTQKSCYYCGRRNHHHRSLCETKFGAFSSRRAQPENVRDSKAQSVLNCNQVKEGKSQDSESTESTVIWSKPTFQFLDSEFDVYVPQTNMEIEYALTINKTQAELERYKNENVMLMQTIAELEKEKETIQRMAIENTEKLKMQAEEISQLRGRLERFESDRENYTRLQQMLRFVGEGTPGINTKAHYDEHRKTVAETSTAMSTNGETATEQHEIYNRLEEIKLLINGKECMQNSRLQSRDFQHLEEKRANAWSTFLEILSKNIKLQMDMH